MNVQAPLSEFLAWERAQPERFEFDGRQPIPMTGGTVAHARIVRRLMQALLRRLPPGHEVFSGDLKVITTDRVRYPDVLVVRGDPVDTDDHVEPVAVFEVLSPSTALTDLRVKPQDYAAAPSIELSVILPQDRARDPLVLRRGAGWQAEAASGTLDLSEIGVAIPLSDVFGA